MNKTELINEIMEVHKRDKFIAGHVYRRYPVDRTGINKKDIKSIELDIIYYLMNSTTDISTLTKRTKKNLFELTEKFDIDWFYTMEYGISTLKKYQTQRHAFIIYGLWNNNLVTFFRKETTSVPAGSTWLYFGNGNRIQVYKLLDLNWINKEFIRKEDWYPFMEALKKLNKTVKNINTEIEKLILLHS